MSQHLRFVMLVLIMCGLTSTVFAQQSGARLAGSYAGAFGEGETNIAAGGAVGYRFTPRLGFEFEAFALPDLEFDDTGDSGRGVAFLTNFVAEFPSPAHWLTPYVQGGGGVATFSQSGVFMANGIGQRGELGRGRFGRPDPRGNLLGDRVSEIDRRRSETGVALSVGGGVDFTVWRGLAVGPAISFLKLFGNVTDRDLTRIGLRTSYRF